MSDNDSDDHSGLALLLLMEEDEKERQAAEEPKCRECPYRNRRRKDTISDALDRKRCKDNAKLFGCAFLIALILAPILTIGAYVHEAIYQHVRQRVAFYEVDREIWPDIAEVEKMVRSGEILELAHRHIPDLE